MLGPALAIALVACSSGGAGPSVAPASVGPSAGRATVPAPSTSNEPSQDPGIEHATGATDIVLRYEEGGGFVMPSFLATNVPHFTLYGDGTVIFRNPMLEAPQPQGSVFQMNPLRTAKLTEAQIQEVLALALGEGGLAGARPQYPYDLVADASTALFSLDAGGIKKTVSVYALGMEVNAVNGGIAAADAPARRAFGKLAQRLTDFDQGGKFATEIYQPERYRGVLIEAPGAVAPDVRDWTWPDLTPADFVPDADPEGVQFPYRAMSKAEIETLGVKDYQGGFQGLVLRAKDGKTYIFSLRPLLPEETK